MDYGLCLPNFPDGATPEGIDAAAALAERLGWSTVWTTDHVLVPTADAGDYGRIYDALMTLAWVGCPASPGAARDERDRRARSAMAWSWQSSSRRSIR